MNIQLNGETREIQEGMSVAALLQNLEIRVEQVAVEINREILDKKGFESRFLQAGDQVEVLSFIGGGSMERVHSSSYIS
jgi:sulfur carrier protein